MRYLWSVLRGTLVLGCASIALATRRGAAQQEIGLSPPAHLIDRGPAFFSVAAPRGERVDAHNAAVFRRRVALDLAGASIPAALDALISEAGVHITYRESAFPTTARVTLRAQSMTVAAALTEILLDAGVDVQLLANGALSLVPRDPATHPARPTAVQNGTTLTGRITDAVTHAPLDQVAVRVEGPGLGALTAADGRYTVHNVPSGTYRVTARRVGYTPSIVTATAATDSTITIDFALAAAATKLNEVVTTAVGDQRRYEVGTVISTIKADSIAPTAPITSLTDLISARAPGVEVIETGGMTGSGEAIRIRGRSSLVLQNDPILIVDGVRQDNSAGADAVANFGTSTNQYAVGTHPTPTRLNDLDFSDIESIDILKGPSASTEYGTDAANGVIVITTKHGTAGRARWNVSAEQAVSEIPDPFPNGYYSWGHTTDGARTPVECVLVPGPSFSPLTQYGSTVGTCAVDSVTQWNPLNHAATSIFGNGRRERYNLSVSGGSAAVRYFMSGGLSNEAGIVRMPPVFRELADTAKLGLPSSALHPNSEQQRSVRANVAATLSPTTDLTATGNYFSTYNETPNAAQLYEGVFFGAARSDPAHYYGYSPFYSVSSASFTPLAQLTELGSQGTGRATGALTTNWRPAGWFVAHAAAGIDHGSQRNQILDYPLANPAYSNASPFLGLADAATDIYSVDLRGTATASLGQNLRAVTSTGVQLVDTRTVGQSATATNITATNLTLNGATAPIVAQQANRQATLGGYGEEQLSFADRLFLTGAVRIDAGSGFGRAYATAAYPKASVSWLALSQGPTTVRVRGAFGESGVQPTNGAAQALYTQSAATLGESVATVTTLSWPGNPNLRPERSEEFEGGADMSLWGNRVSMELTEYSKTTRDALVNINLVGDVCCYTYQENIGEVRNTGTEGNVTVALVQGRRVTWDVAVNGSVNHNTLISLAPGVLSQTVYAFFTLYRQARGYPLYGIWGPRVTYADANHDGIIEANEVAVADSASYLGPSLPTREASMSTHIALWRGAVTASALVDYRGGYRLATPMQDVAILGGRALGQNDRHAPLWLQARSVATAIHGTYPEPSLYVENASFVRFRELSMTYTVPQQVSRSLRVQGLSVTAAVRNLKLWTRYTGGDPETSNPSGANIQPLPTSNGNVVNNDIRENLGTVPLTRYWVMRLNIGI